MGHEGTGMVTDMYQTYAGYAQELSSFKRQSPSPSLGVQNH